MSTPPMIQLDTGSKYYKTMIDGIVYNFKRTINEASENAYSRANITSSKAIAVATHPGLDGAMGSQPNEQAQLSIRDVRIEGLQRPKVASVYMAKKKMKLNVVFNYKNVKLLGRCSIGSTHKSSPVSETSKLLLEATNWNASWSASVASMIGREHFERNKVHTSHLQQRLSFNLKGCAGGAVPDERLKWALLRRLNEVIEEHLLEIMEAVLLQPSDSGKGSSPVPALAGLAGPAKERGKRASLTNQLAAAAAKRAAKSTIKSAAKSTAKQASNAVNQAANQAGRRTLKRNKRQTPCEPGDELDDYVDSLFKFGTKIVKAMRMVTLPNVTIELPDYNLKIFLYDGKSDRAYQFRRAKPAWVFCNNETVSLGLTIEFDELRAAYKYRVISGTRLLFDGDLEAMLSPRVQAQFSQKIMDEDSEEPVMQRLDRLRVFRLGPVHVIIRGLGNLTHSLSLMINSYLNENQEDLQPALRMIEGDAVRMVNKMLATVSVPLLSVAG